MMFQSFSSTRLIEQSANRSIHIASQLETDGRPLRQAFEQLCYLVLTKKIPSANDQLTLAIGIASAALTRSSDIKPYATQVLAAHFMTRGIISEMATGEGKSFAVLLTAIAFSALGWNVHIATANDYLAERDCQLASRVLSSLGISSGYLRADMERTSTRSLYESDVVYGTLASLAFDYLKDQLQLQNCQRADVFQPGRFRLACVRRHCLLIDEIDHCLIDEASTPFIVSEQSTHDTLLNANASQAYRVAGEVAHEMEERDCYQFTSDGKQIELTRHGFELARNCKPAIPLARPWSDYVMNALRSRVLMKRDRDYVVQNCQIRLIDKATGRLVVDRQWQDGLHQAIQCKEGLAIDEELHSRAEVTADQFVRIYRRVAGCSGTAADCKKEFASVYGMRVHAIPEFRPCQRQLWPPKFFANQTQKRQAIVDEVLNLQASGRPTLIGTRSIAQSIQLANQLRLEGLTVHLLNGVQDGAEADVIAQAGRRGTITVATDLAGRGTDISIDQQVAELGGLHVIVSEVGRSPRLDRQLIGRAARQGQSGSARVFVAADDDLLQQYSPSLQRFLLTHSSEAYDAQQLWREVLKAGRRSDRHAAVARAAAISSQKRQQRQYSNYA